MKRFFCFFILLLALAGCGDSQASQSSQGNVQATATANAASISATNIALQNAGPAQTVTLPTPTVDTFTPVAQPTIKPISGPALVSSDLGAFITQYGQPNAHSTPSGGLYHFQQYSGSNIDFLIIMTDAADGGVYTNRVENVTAQATDAGADTGWTQQQASATCGAFLPRDAMYKSRVDLTTGYDKIYFSASTAKLFPVSAFTDASNNQTQAGLFDVLYLYKVSPMIDSCDILIGTEQTQ